MNRPSHLPPPPHLPNNPSLPPPHAPPYHHGNHPPPPPPPNPVEPAPPPPPHRSTDSKIKLLRKRHLQRRTQKEDKAAYGRTFKGCGQQSDYDATTKLGEGTFGEVHKAVHKQTGRTVALKRILMHNEKEGMPVTALREIKILKALRHDCIVEILDMFVVRSTEKDPLSVYMVFPYMDHDLTGLLENERVKLQPSHIKLYMKQLLEGTAYMHRNHIIHRDMKAANLLISNDGSLKIADFGLARAFDSNPGRGGKERRYTNCVVTRWYRPPELLMGARQYGGEVDIWGIGCVLGEMFHRRPILPGNSDLDQLEKIWTLCGTPTQHNWPNHDLLPGCEGVNRFNYKNRTVKQTYESLGPETVDLLDKLLIINPKDRITAMQALEHPYFWTDPMPADPKTLPSYESSHEFDKRAHRQHHHAPAHVQPPANQFNRGPGPPPGAHGPPAPGMVSLPGQGYPPIHMNPHGPPPPHGRGPPGGYGGGPPMPPGGMGYPAQPPGLPYPPPGGYPRNGPMPPSGMPPGGPPGHYTNGRGYGQGRPGGGGGGGGGGRRDNYRNGPGGGGPPALKSSLPPPPPGLPVKPVAPLGLNEPPIGGGPPAPPPGLPPPPPRERPPAEPSSEDGPSSLLNYY